MREMHRCLLVWLSPSYHMSPLQCVPHCLSLSRIPLRYRAAPVEGRISAASSTLVNGIPRPISALVHESQVRVPQTQGQGAWDIKRFGMLGRTNWGGYQCRVRTKQKREVLSFYRKKQGTCILSRKLVALTVASLATTVLGVGICGKMLNVILRVEELVTETMFSRLCTILQHITRERGLWAGGGLRFPLLVGRSSISPII